MKNYFLNNTKISYFRAHMQCIKIIKKINKEIIKYFPMAFRDLVIDFVLSIWNTKYPNFTKIPLKTKRIKK